MLSTGNWISRLQLRILKSARAYPSAPAFWIWTLLFHTKHQGPDFPGALGGWGGVSMKTVAASIMFRRSGNDQMSAKTCAPQSSPSVLLSLSLWGKDICHFWLLSTISRILVWVAYPFSGRSSWPSNLTGVSRITGRFLPTEPSGKPFQEANCLNKKFVGGRVGDDVILFNTLLITADLQCCVSFRGTAKWFRYAYTYIHSFSDSFLI